MTDLPGSDRPFASPPPGGGRHRSADETAAPPRRRALVVVIAVVAVLAIGTTTALVWRSATATDASGTDPAVAAAASTSSPPVGTTGASASGADDPSGTAAATATSGPGAAAAGCGDDGTITVAAAPEIADVVAEVLAALAAGVAEDTGAALPCPVEVLSAEPAEVTAEVQAGAAPAELWIPDSSAWVARAELAAGSPTIAISPVVMATAASTALSLSDGVGGILGTRLTGQPVRVGLPDPATSAAAAAAVLAMQQAVSGAADARAALTWGFRSTPADLPADRAGQLDRAATDPGVAVPVTEQAVATYEDRAALGMVPLGSDGASLDYPFVTLDAAASAVATPVVQALLGTDGRSALDAAGFRSPAGEAGPALSAAATTGSPAGDPLPDLATIDGAVQAVTISNEPTRLLAVLDVSGSMQAEVPGAGGATRIDLAKAAAGRGLSLYPSDSQLGLWTFSTMVTPTSDHQEHVPVGPLGPGPDGVTGAQTLADAVAGVQAIPNGGTGLYDTVLDGVRAMRAGWDPDRVNVLLVLSDGMNDDANGIALPQLLSTLTAEQDAARPVPVITIAFGPDSDVAAMTEIGRVTGGATYVSQDPLDVGEIFLDAVGQRLCRPTC